MNEHLNSIAGRENVHVLYKSGPLNGQTELLHSPGNTIQADGGSYGLSHRLAGDVLVYFFFPAAK